jgi:hypothetical protein
MKALWILFLFVFLTGCANMVEINPNAISNVTITDSHIGNYMSVDLSVDKILVFFQEKSFLLKGGHREIHDYYTYAPFFVSGAMSYQGSQCEWEINAGGFGSITCEDREWYFGCDDCEDFDF